MQGTCGLHCDLSHAAQTGPQKEELPLAHRNVPCVKFAAELNLTYLVPDTRCDLLRHEYSTENSCLKMGRHRRSPCSRDTIASSLVIANFPLCEPLIFNTRQSAGVKLCLQVVRILPIFFWRRDSAAKKAYKCTLSLIRDGHTVYTE